MPCRKVNGILSFLALLHNSTEDKKEVNSNSWSRYWEEIWMDPRYYHAKPHRINPNFSISEILSDYQNLYIFLEKTNRLHTVFINWYFLDEFVATYLLNLDNCLLSHLKVIEADFERNVVVCQGVVGKGSKVGREDDRGDQLKEG